MAIDFTDEEPTRPRITVVHFRCTECLAEVVTDPVSIAPVCDVCCRYMAPVNHRVRGIA
jgi:hypothetical protein